MTSLDEKQTSAFEKYLDRTPRGFQSGLLVVEVLETFAEISACGYCAIITNGMKLAAVVMRFSWSRKDAMR